MTLTRSARLALTVVLAIYGFRILLHPEAGWFMDSVDLPIHETGHFVLSRRSASSCSSPAGRCSKILIPAVFVGYFFRRKDRHGASICALRGWRRVSGTSQCT